MDNRKIEARFCWDAFPRQYSSGMIGGKLSGSNAVDCDARAIFFGEDGKPISEHISYSSPTLFDGAAIHSGDNHVGNKEDDEIIMLDLPNLPDSISNIILTLDLFKEKKTIKAGAFQRVSLRITDSETKEEIARCDDTNLSSANKLVELGMIIRSNAGWDFVVVNKSYNVERIEEYLSM